MIIFICNALFTVISLARSTILILLGIKYFIVEELNVLYTLETLLVCQVLVEVFCLYKHVLLDVLLCYCRSSPWKCQHATTTTSINVNIATRFAPFWGVITNGVTLHTIKYISEASILVTGLICRWFCRTSWGRISTAKFNRCCI